VRVKVAGSKSKDSLLSLQSLLEKEPLPQAILVNEQEQRFTTPTEITPKTKLNINHSKIVRNSSPFIGLYQPWLTAFDL
jgi:hypothetical protein